MTFRLIKVTAMAAILAAPMAAAAQVNNHTANPAQCVREWTDGLAGATSTPGSARAAGLEHMRYLKDTIYPHWNTIDFIAYQCEIDRALAKTIGCDELRRLTGMQC